jgi:predicted alpha/beta hydrolase
MTTTSAHRFKAEDGLELGADVFEASSPRAVAVLAGGTGIPRRFYRAFAEHLARAGYTTLSFDYRGIGGSRPPSLRGFDATMSDWGTRDISGALAEGRRLAGGAPAFYVGHSVGGQLLGLARGVENLRAAAFVGSSTGTWWRMSGSYRWVCAAIWYGFVPLTTALVGFGPASWLKQGEDLPRGVVREWARWCRSDDYFASHLASEELSRYARLDVPLLSLAFTDDPIANEVTVPSLLRHYTSARITHEMRAPRDVGMSAVGHFGMFKPRAREALWGRIPEFFDGALQDGLAAHVAREENAP